MLFQNLTLKQKLYTGFSIPLVSIIALAILVYVSIHSLLDANHWVDHTHKVIREAQSLQSGMIDMETGMRGYLVSGKDEFLEPYVEGKKVFTRTIGELKQTVSDNPSQVTLLREIEALEAKWLSEAAQPKIDLRRKVNRGREAADNFRVLSARIVGKQRFDALRAQLAIADGALEDRNDLQGRYHLQNITMAMINQETGQRGFLLSGQEISLEPFHQGEKAFDLHFDKLMNHLQRVSYNASTITEALNSAKDLAQRWRADAAIPEIEARREINQYPETIQDITALIEAGTGKAYMDQIREQIGRFVAVEERLIVERSEKADAIGDNTITITYVGAAIVVLLIGFFSNFIVRNVQHKVGGEPEQMAAISRKIADGDLTINIPNTGNETGIYAAMRDMVNNLRPVMATISETAAAQSQSSQELAAISEQTQHNTLEQQRSTDQVAVAIEQMHATSTEVASSTAGAADSANLARDMVEKGHIQVEQSANEINKLSDTLNDTANTIEELAQNAANINNILDVIKGIAEQTNLLALNAAIEAARAGEQGRGFAVVADEVRALAQDTANSTHEIENMIKTVQESANLSVQSMENGRKQAVVIVDRTTGMRESLGEIKLAVDNISDMTAQIASAAEEQTVTAKDISHRAVEIREQSHETGQGAEQIALSTKQLSTLSVKLQQEVAQFSV